MPDDTAGATRSGKRLTWDQMMSTTPQQLRDEGRFPLTIFDEDDEMFSHLAHFTANFIQEQNERNERTVFILPVGPKNHYPLLAQICNEKKISWKNVHAFNMDEWLTWDCQLMPLEHPYSFEGFMLRNLFFLLDPDLRPPAKNLRFPKPANMTEIGPELRALGGADIAFAGFGYSGHVANNEPPNSRWVHVSVDEYKQGETRIVPLNDETLIAFAHRTAGGDTRQIPPVAVTLGMKDILASKRILFVSNSGAWKQHTLRVLLLHDPTVNYPCTLAAGHANVEVWVDGQTARSPQRTFRE